MFLERSEFMVELKLALSNLITSQVKIAELKEQQESLISSAKTRLKWAAGSNPALNEVWHESISISADFRRAYFLSVEFLTLGDELVRREYQNWKRKFHAKSSTGGNHHQYLYLRLALRIVESTDPGSCT